MENRSAIFLLRLLIHLQRSDAVKVATRVLWDAALLMRLKSYPPRETGGKRDGMHGTGMSSALKRRARIVPEPHDTQLSNLTSLGPTHAYPPIRDSFCMR